MKNEDVKIGMRVVYKPGTPNEDRGVVTQKHSHTNDSWWVVWDSDGAENWIAAYHMEPESQAIEQKEEEMSDRIEMMMKLLNAAKEGKQIEQADAGHWYASDIAFVNVSNAHQFRVKPEQRTTIGYRRFVCWDGQDYVVDTCSIGRNINRLEMEEGFICWIDTDYLYHSFEV